jgi:perosamine synthetase
VKQFWPDKVGFKYKISNIQAAIGCAQMQRIHQLIGQKRSILQYYREGLSDLPEVQVNPEDRNIVNGAWMPTAVFEQTTAVTREKLQGAFAAENIDARVFFYPLSSLPMFDDVPGNKYAWDIPNRAINLPSYHDMTTDDQDRIIKVVRGLVKRRGD